MGLGSILTLIYLGSISAYHASLLVPTIVMLNKIKRDGYVSTGKGGLAKAVYDKVFTSCIGFDGEQMKSAMLALIPGYNTILAISGVVFAIRNVEKYKYYDDLKYRGFIKKKDDDDKDDTNGKKEGRSIEKKTSSKTNDSIKKMSRSEIIGALKAERDKLSSKNIKSKNKVMVK